MRDELIDVRCAGWGRQIITKLSHKLNEKQVRQAVEYLNDEGFIYTSTSDEHYKLARAS